VPLLVLYGEPGSWPGSLFCGPEISGFAGTGETDNIAEHGHSHKRRRDSPKIVARWAAGDRRKNWALQKMSYIRKAAVFQNGGSQPVLVLLLEILID
jgi:hypothetical protein